MTAQLATTAAGKHRHDSGIVIRSGALRSQRIVTRKRMTKIFDTAPEASIELVLVCKCGHRHGERAYSTRLLLAIQPGSRRKQIENRTAVTESPQRRRQP